MLKAFFNKHSTGGADFICFPGIGFVFQAVGDDLKTLYNFLITMQLGLGLFIMTISVFHFTFDTKNNVSIKFFTYLMYQFTEIALYCYCGTFLQTASTDVTFAMYKTSWFNMKKRYRDTCQMVMVRAQNPVSLIAVRLYPVNVVTLLSMMQFSYSTSALLSRLTDPL